jgi:hypothetical protein
MEEVATEFSWQVRANASNVAQKPLNADRLQQLLLLALTKLGLLPPAEISDEQAGQIVKATP